MILGSFYRIILYHRLNSASVELELGIFNRLKYSQNLRSQNWLLHHFLKTHNDVIHPEPPAVLSVNRKTLECA